MKKLNIKWKIMVWHSAALIFLMIVTLPIMYFVISNHLYSETESLLLSQAGQATKALRLGNGIDEPNSEIDIIQTGTYIMVYSNDNLMVSGMLPEGFISDDVPSFDNIYYRNLDGHKWIVLDRKIIVHGRITGWFRMIKPLDTLSDALAYFRNVIIIIILIYLVFSALGMLGGGFIPRALSPVKQITKTAQQISQGDLSQRINVNGNDEVGKLAATLNEMIDCLEDTFNREKRFSSDVSHELRTPVAAIMINAEEALNDDKTVDEYKESLQTILRESRKMNSLISQLLVISRSNSGKFKHDMELINISRLVKTVVEELSERNSHQDISIFSETEDDVVMSVDETLFMRMLINLIDNAVKYNIPGGWVKVYLKRDNNDVLLSVQDNGIGISMENLPHIWERFYKADPSRIDSSPGLGLSIVKWIAELHNGTVSVKSELGKGSIFELRFQQTNNCL